jgi:hypothetical protein
LTAIGGFGLVEQAPVQPTCDVGRGDFDDTTAIGAARAPRPVSNAVRDVMFVIDTIHAKPGTSGRLWIKSASLER